MKDLAVSDATPLIHLAKIGKINHLRDIFGQIIIPKQIYEEVIIKGKEEDEVQVISQLIESKFILVKDPANIIEFPSIHEGEKASLSLCQELNIKKILIDDKDGIDIAIMLGLKPIRSTAIILKLLTNKIISYEEYKKSLFQLVESGYYLDAETYKILIEEGDKYR